MAPILLCHEGPGDWEGAQAGADDPHLFLGPTDTHCFFRVHRCPSSSLGPMNPHATSSGPRGPHHPPEGPWAPYFFFGGVHEAPHPTIPQDPQALLPSLVNSTDPHPPPWVGWVLSLVFPLLVLLPNEEGAAMWEQGRVDSRRSPEEEEVKAGKYKGVKQELGASSICDPGKWGAGRGHVGVGRRGQLGRGDLFFSLEVSFGQSHLSLLIPARARPREVPVTS